MSLGVVLAAAILLTAERVCYVWIARSPAAFRAWCARPVIARLGEPVAVVRTLFYVQGPPGRDIPGLGLRAWERIARADGT